MSLDYSLFLRDQPELAAYEGRFSLRRDDRGGFVLGGMRVWTKPYTPTDDDDDVLVDHPWRDEIRWVVAASGRHGDATYDDFEDLMSELGARYRGGLWCDHGDDVRWYWWDRDALAAKAAAWKVKELVAFLTWARGGDEGLPQTGGVREQVVEIALGRVDAIRPLKQQQQLVLELWEGHEDYDDALAGPAGDVLLGLDAKGSRKLRDAQRALTDKRAVAADAEAPLPTTVAELAALHDRATRDPSAERILDRGLAHTHGNTFMRAEYGGVLLARARAGAAKPDWMWTVAHWPQLATAPESASRTTRDTFGSLGTLAQAIVQKWDADDAHAAQVHDMLELRRRGGEIFAGVPDEIRALAVAGHRREAVEAYARRYGLSLERSQQVVDANV